MNKIHVLDIGYCQDYQNKSKGNKENGKLRDFLKDYDEIEYMIKTWSI